MRLTWSLLLSAGCALGFGACASVVPPDLEFAAARCQTVYDDGVEGMPTFELGAILSVTKPDGNPDDAGVFETRAMQLAIQELNDHRDVAGKRFRLRVCDTRADWSVGGGKVTTDLTKWLIEHGKVQAILSDASSDTQTIQAVTVPRGVLVMAISATSGELTNLADKGLVWRVAPSDVYQGAVLAHAVSSTVAETDAVAVLAVQSPYGDSLVDALGKHLGKRLSAHTFGTDGKGFDSALQAAALAKPKALIVIGNAPLAMQVANARAAIPALANVGLFLSDGACDGELVKQTKAAGVSLAGARCTRPGHPPTPIYDHFRERFQQRFAADPAQSSYTEHAYDAVYSVALAHAWALRQGGEGKVDGIALAEGLRHLAKGPAHPYKPSEITAMIANLGKGQAIDVEGASGPLDFNPDTGEAPSAYEAWTLGAGGELLAKQYFSVLDQGGKVVVVEASGK